MGHQTSALDPKGRNADTSLSQTGQNRADPRASDRRTPSGSQRLAFRSSSETASRRNRGCTSSGKRRGVERLVVVCGPCPGDEDSGAARRGNLVDRPTGARNDKIGCGQQIRHVAGELELVEALRCGTGTHLAASGHEEHALANRNAIVVRQPQCIVDRAGAERANKRDDYAFVVTKAERGTPLRPCRLDERAIDGTTGHEVLRRRAAGDGEGEKDTVDERCGKPVGQADTGVGLAQRRREAMMPGGGEHRTRHVPASTKHRIGTDLLDDPRARERRDDSLPHRLDQLHAGRAREPRNVKRQERVTAGGHHLGLDAVGRASERDVRTTRAQLVGDGQSGRNVAHRSACGDQDPHRHASKASPRRGGARPRPAGAYAARAASWAWARWDLASRFVAGAAPIAARG